jgi:hypothetical protein
MLGIYFYEGTTMSDGRRTANSNKYISASLVTAPATGSSSSASSSSAGISINGFTRREIEEKIHNKIELDSTLSTELAATLNKDSIIQLIVNTMIKLPAAAERIIRVLADSRFHITLTTDEGFARIFNGGNAMLSFYSPTMTIYFTNAQHLSSDLVSHEFRHADCYLRHVTINSREAILPIIFVASAQAYSDPIERYLATTQAYSNALDIGDKRIAEYIVLWQQAKSGETLSNDNAKKLQRYQQAAQDCLPRLVTTSCSLQLIKKQRLQIGAIIEKDYLLMKVLAMQSVNGEVLLTLEPTDPAMGIFRIPDDVSQKLASSEYCNSSHMIKLAERDAYTFQCLSSTAIATFYPEAQEMIEADIQECMTPTKQSGTGVILQIIVSNLRNEFPDKTKFHETREINHEIIENIHTLQFKP